MRAVILDESVGLELMDALKLEVFTKSHLTKKDPDQPATMEEVHRAFNYVVVRWLQEKGFKVIR